MTPRELFALRAVWLDGIERQNYMHASIQATLFNAHFDTGGVPWTAEDLLGRGDRQARKMQTMKDKMVTMQMRRFSVAPLDESLVPDFILELERNQKQTVN